MSLEGLLTHPAALCLFVQTHPGNGAMNREIAP